MMISLLVEVVPTDPAKQGTWFFKLQMPAVPREDEVVECSAPGIEARLYKVLRVIWTPTSEEQNVWLRVEEV